MADHIRDDPPLPGCTVLMAFLRRNRVGVVIAVLVASLGGALLESLRLHPQDPRGAGRSCKGRAAPRGDRRPRAQSLRGAGPSRLRFGTSWPRGGPLDPGRPEGQLPEPAGQ